MTKTTQSKNQSGQIKQLQFGHRAEVDALFKSIGDGAISTDEFGRITGVNLTAQQILGYSEGELLGTWFPKSIIAVTADDQPINLMDRPITKAYLTGKPVAKNIYYRRKDGYKIPLAVNVSPIILHDKPVGAIEVFRDITLQQEVDRMKSEFISLASHQLRTPLSAVKTYTHMLYEGYMGDLNSAQKKALMTIIGSADRMNELISTLLNVTRIESGSVEVTPKLLRIDKIAEEVIKELSLAADKKSIKLIFTVCGKASSTIRTDSLIVKEIIANIVSNAIKYTPDGGKVELIINLRKNNIVVDVTDTGWGIPKYSQDQIFSKFFRAQNIVQRETIGTGLGLYLVKGLLEALGGKIWFVSDEQSGTKFSFSLPRKQKLPILIKAPAPIS
ncbi:MAG TPA: ATP-binding protein [Candidatus Saccharimonadales bacterium]|nr:ATP-binding protein [Candidatus Saccharimonadales bacterium]